MLQYFTSVLLAQKTCWYVHVVVSRVYFPDVYPCLERAGEPGQQGVLQHL